MLSSMRPGRRSCAGLKLSAWRGWCWRMVSMVPSISVSKRTRTDTVYRGRSETRAELVALTVSNRPIIWNRLVFLRGLVSNSVCVLCVGRLCWLKWAWPCGRTEAQSVSSPLRRSEPSKALPLATLVTAVHHLTKRTRVISGFHFKQSPLCFRPPTW